jgi:hypothetical protein
MSPQIQHHQGGLANEAVVASSKILLVHQDLLDFARTMDLSLQSVYINAATTHWKKATSIIQVVDTEIEEAPKNKGSMRNMKKTSKR